MAGLLPLGLGVRQRAGGKGALVAPAQGQAEKALKRDGNACRCCGFVSGKYQRVVSAAACGFGKDVTTDEFVTLCFFCEYCFALDVAGLAGAGILIWLPEISQADLHHIARAIHVARSAGLPDDHPVVAAATRAYDSLLSRRAEAKKRLGSDDPLLLATVFLENLPDKDYAERGAKLEGLRFFPYDRFMGRGRDGADVNAFPAVAEYWRSPQGPWGSLPLDSWPELFATFAKAS